MSAIRLAVLLSGKGTSLQNLLDHIAAGQLAAEVKLVISNRRGAYGLERARQAGIPTWIVTRQAFADATGASRAIFDPCRAAGIDLVCLAGFMQFLPIPDDFLHRVMNIHPSLLPAFGGQGMFGHHVHQAVLDYGVKVTGCTMHFADNQYDHGPIILQRAVRVDEQDTPETLAARVFAEECVAYPEAIGLFAAKRLRIHGRRVHILPEQV